MIDRIRSLADDVFPEVVRLRRAIHRKPELAFDELYDYLEEGELIGGTQRKDYADHWEKASAEAF